MSDSHETLQHAPLLSPGFVWKLTAVVAVLCLITLAIAMTGRMIGGTIALAGNTTDDSLHEIVIGNDVLLLPANVIRFESQRVSGVRA
jgi:type 1 fimbria pilin